MPQIKLLITDFDGTLVETFEANFRAYQKAFAKYDLVLSKEDYQASFGLRFDDFMKKMNVNDEEIKRNIHCIKSHEYPTFFDQIIINNSLLTILANFRASGGVTAIASTALKKNLMNVLEYIGAKDIFSLIIAGEDVKNGKPNPEIYNTVLLKTGMKPSETLVFEDSITGIEAAKAANLSYIKIEKHFFYGNSN